MKKKLLLFVTIILFSGCQFIPNKWIIPPNTPQDVSFQLTQKKIIKLMDQISFSEIILGHWRNYEEKTDYLFNKEGQSLSILKEDGSTDCTYEIKNSIEDKRYMEIWFKCPMQDWPGYAELHVFEFSENLDAFTDTFHIQGVPYRVNGKFIKVGSFGADLF